MVGKEKRLRMLGFWVSLLGFLWLFVSAPVFAGDKPIVLKLGHGSPSGDARDKGANRFAELVQQKTNGQVRSRCLSLRLSRVG